MISRIALMCAALLIRLDAPAQEQDLSKVEIKVSRVAGTVYLLQGAGGNMAASVGADGTLLVDDEFAPLAGRIATALRQIAGNDHPLRFVINTHYHGDHTGSNAPLAAEGATVIAHDQVRARLASGGTAGNGGKIRLDNKPAAKGALPLLTFGHDLSVHLNGEDVQAIHVPAGHTDGDVIVFFPKANVVHMGDDYVRYGFPFIDVASGGSPQGMIAACELALAKLPPDVRVIPGHGELSNVGELRDYLTMLKETTAVVEKALRAGRSLEQMQQDQILAPWSKKYSGDFVTTDLFIETLYNALSRKPASASAAAAHG